MDGSDLREPLTCRRIRRRNVNLHSDCASVRMRGVNKRDEEHDFNRLPSSLGSRIQFISLIFSGICRVFSERFTTPGFPHTSRVRNVFGFAFPNPFSLHHI